MPDGTVTRSFRIDESALKVIESEAERQSLTVNTLVNHLLVKYARADRYLAKIGMLQVMDSETIKDIFAKVPDGQLAEIGKKHGKALAFQNLVHAMTGGSSTQNVFQLLRTMCDLNAINYTEIADSRKTTFTIVHNLNRQFSVFLANLISSALDNAGTWPKTVLDDRIVTFEYEI